MAEIHGECFPDAPWSADALADLIAKPTSVAETSNTGFAIAQIVATEAEILTIAVSPAKQARGNGTALLAGLCATLAEQGADAVFLEVAEDNGLARALYSEMRVSDRRTAPGLLPTARFTACRCLDPTLHFGRSGRYAENVLTPSHHPALLAR